MTPWTSDEFLHRHLPHRLGVLHGFKMRAGAEPHEIHCAMKDGALITCRVLWSLLGVRVDSTDERLPSQPSVVPHFAAFSNLPAGITVSRITSETDFASLPSPEEIILVLVAANKCVAHLDAYPEHGVTADILDRVIDVTLAEIKARVRPKA
jgi:hypothetical protein